MRRVFFVLPKMLFFPSVNYRFVFFKEGRICCYLAAQKHSVLRAITTAGLDQRSGYCSVQSRLLGQDIVLTDLAQNYNKIRHLSIYLIGNGFCFFIRRFRRKLKPKDRP